MLRAAGSLASLAFAKATAATLRRDPINVAARTARHGSRTYGQAIKRERQENHAHWYPKIALTGSGPKRSAEFVPSIAEFVPWIEAWHSLVYESRKP